MLPSALAQTVDVPLWLLMGLAGYHRVLKKSGEALKRANRAGGGRRPGRRRRRESEGGSS